jgi:hypothetical protein
MVCSGNDTGGWCRHPALPHRRIARRPRFVYARGMAKPLRFHAPDRSAWTAWLEQHHATAKEVFLVFYRKDAGQPSIGYAEAVEEALYY